MKKVLLTFDLEEFDLPLELNQKISNEEMYRISLEGLNNILNILNKFDISATFFTTANFAIMYPQVMRKISINHEIASHGFSHSHPINLENMGKAKKEKEKIIGKPILGFRAPRWKIKDITILEKLGFKYDSSTHPIYLPGRYNNLKQKRKVHKINNLIEIPMSTLPPNFSIFWIAFKNLPLIYSKIFTKLNFLKSSYTMLVFHPWEFADLSKINIPKHIKKTDGINLSKKLNDYLKFCKKNNYGFETCEEFLRV